IAPSSRFALSLKPSIAYRVLNFCAGWKKQTILPSLAYAGIPYQVVGVRAGALAVMTAWSRSPRTRSGSVISASFASTALSLSALAAGARRAAVFSSWARSFIAPRSSAVNPPDVLPLAAVPVADFCSSFIEISFRASVGWRLRRIRLSDPVRRPGAGPATTGTGRPESDVKWAPQVTATPTTAASTDGSGYYEARADGPTCN